ncbi:MAG: hypothetical protein KME31_27705 [Tolypothrix carrinoi HA7290-LM1]|jgi:hypothetical protein|nr:hypothetical protein [Tolypothrix carrinoi HA7290-LM1]
MPDHTIFFKEKSKDFDLRQENSDRLDGHPLDSHPKKVRLEKRLCFLALML